MSSVIFAGETFSKRLQGGCLIDLWGYLLFKVAETPNGMCTVSRLLCCNITMTAVEVSLRMRLIL